MATAHERHPWLWLAAATVPLLLITGAVIVTRPAFQDRMLASANARFSRVVRREFLIGSVRYRFPLSIVIRDVAVASRDSLCRGSLADIPEIMVAVNPVRSLFARKLVVSTVAVRGAVIEMEQFRDGTWNIAGLIRSDSAKPKPKGKASFPTLALSDLRLEDLTIRLTMPKTKEVVEHIGLRLGVRMGGSKLVADIRQFQAFDSTRSFGITGLKGRVAIKGDTVRADHVELQAGGSRISLSAWINTRDSTIAVSDCQADLDLGDVAALTNKSRSAWQGTIRISATAGGSTAAPQAQLTLNAGPCVCNGIRLEGIETRLSVAGGEATLERLLVRCGGGEIIAQAQLDYKHRAYKGAVTASRIDLGKMLPPAKKPLASDLNARLDFSGKGFALNAMTGQARLVMGRSMVNAVPISQLESRITVGDGAITIEKFTLQSGQASLGISGDVFRDAVSIELETDEIELSQFGPLVGLNKLSGKLRFTGLISGPLKNPDVIGTFRLKEAEVASFACHYFDGSMSIKSIGTRPVGDGKFTMREIIVGTQTVDLAEMQVELRGMDWGGFSVHVVKDTLTEAQVTGRVEIERKNITAVISKLNYYSVDQYVCNSQPIQVTVQGSDVTLKPTELLIARGRLKLAGHYRSDRTFQTSISGRDIDSRRLVKLAGLDKTVHGAIDFDIEASGPLADPVLRLSVDVANLRYEQFTADGLGLRADYAAKTAHLRKLTITRYGQESEITADIGVDLGVGPTLGKLQDKPMSADVVLRDIGTWVFFPMADLLSVYEGRVDVNVKASGTPSKPVLAGNLTINQAKMVLRPLGMYLHNVQAMAHFNADSVVVDNVTGVTEGAGTVQLGGHLLLKQFLPTSMRFDVATVKSPIRNIPFIEANVNSQIIIGGSMDYIKISGKAQVNSALITLPFAPAEEPPPPEGNPKPMDLDLSITGANGIWLRNKDADIELKIDNLNVRMSQNVLFLSGRLEPLRGVYRFLDRSFDITGGDLTFTNASVINPGLNLSAQTTIYGSGTGSAAGESQQKTVVYLTVGGNALQPKLSFKSDPVMSEQDILTLVGAGTTIKDIGSMDVTGQAIGRGLDYALGMVTGKIQKGTGLDMLKVKTITGSEKGAQVTLGKYVAPKVFVSYSQGFSSNLSNEFKAEYLFGPRSAVFAQKNDQGKYNLGVRMKFKY